MSAAGGVHDDARAGGTEAFRQWLGLLGAPAVWLTHFVAIYALAARACRWMTALPVHIVSGTTLVLIVIIGGIAWRNFEAASGTRAGDVPAISAGRERLMGAVGLMMAILFFLVTVAQWLPTWTADPCQR